MSLAVAHRILGLDPGTRPQFEPLRSCRPGVTVLIPTHSDRAHDGGGTGRLDTLARCLESLAGQPRHAGPPLSVVIVDGGLTDDDADRIRAALSTTGLPHELVPAPVAARSAAATRNAGLAWLAEQPDGSPLVRRHLLFLDDDTALAPGGPAALADVLDRDPGAVAVCPKIVTVASVTDWLDREPPAPVAPVSSRVLPGSLHDGRYDLLTVTSHGSLVAGRVVGLLVRADLVLGWLRHGGRLFYPGTPRGSSEDMLAMATLSRLGQLRTAPDVRVADLVRRTPVDTRRQQLAWGYDHGWLPGELGAAGLLDPGLHVLTWDEATGWWQHHRPDPHRYGYLVNPQELAVLGAMLAATARDDTTVRALFGVSAAELAAATAALTGLLIRLPDLLRSAEVSHRPDLPPLVPRGFETLREGLDGLLAHLAGNALASLTHGLADDGLPARFLYGLRQGAAGAITPRGNGTVV
ncbi:glycosyltransferase family 2 protein [Plantactinospora sp. S1510]|uniref:Glycosyltransferase family 2 protein n=1 Tax=Plantactinospora alkalitolerans TaxID=2789879 RepID=A0ABS0GTY9_9ACTN|nr:glycosyltransferase family A protein [Plantactinospora alkalitolerans]MBF9129662.1 glycosyltransferase family 2 protein [Plantactinospora alkalitolerans]